MAATSIFHEISPEVLKLAIGSNWQKEKPKKLDFSGTDFNLETLDGPAGGLLNMNLNLQKCEFLDISNNKLVDIDRYTSSNVGFINLKKLNASNNSLFSPHLSITSLTELNLSYNQLVHFPSLENLPELQILNLAHNRIDSFWKEASKSHNLLEIDLSYNDIDAYPSQLIYFLQFFKQCPLLEILKLKGNPFTKYFPEYQYFVLKELSTLKQLDDVIIDNPAALQKIFDNNEMDTLEHYDALYQDRRIGAELGSNIGREVVETGIMKVDLITLQKIIDPLLDTAEEDALIIIQKFLQTCSAIQGADIQLFTNKSESAARIAIEHLLQTLILILERHESNAHFIIRGITKLAGVSEYDFGVDIIKLLESMMYGHQSLTDEIISCIEETFFPLFGDMKVVDNKMTVIMKGLCQMHSAAERIAESLTNIMITLCEAFHEIQKNQYLTELISIACLNNENAAEAVGQGIIHEICKLLLDFPKPPPYDSVQFYIYTSYINICARCAKHNRRAAAYLVKQEVHNKVVFRHLRDLYNQPTNQFGVKKARLTSTMIECMLGIMCSNESGMNAALNKYYIVDIFLIAAKEDHADPVILAASINGLRIILEDRKYGSEYLNYIINQLGSGNNLLEYINGQKYKRLHDSAVKHKTNVDNLTVIPPTPSLESLNNKYVYNVLISICDFFKYHMINNDNAISKKFNENLINKDYKMFEVLTVPDDLVKLSAITCISYNNLDVISYNEIEKLVTMLKQISGIRGGVGLDVLQELIKIMTRIVNDKGSAGYLLKKHFLPLVFNSIYMMIEVVLNIKIKSHEVKRSQLCVAAVNCLRTASLFDEYKKHLRHEVQNRSFKIILKFEESFSSNIITDIPVESTWTGRNLHLLTDCCTGTDTINPLSKVGLRIYVRMADVLQGRSDFLDIIDDIKLRDICLREQKMWDEYEMSQSILSLSVLEKSARLDEHIWVVKNDGLSKMLMPLMKFASRNLEKRLIVARRRNNDSEYWASKLKGQKEAYEEYHDNDIIFEQLLFCDIILEDPPIDSSARQHLGHYYVMQAFQKSQHLTDEETKAMYMELTHKFYGSAGLWKNITTGIMNSSYVVSAFFRILYCCLVLPGTPDVYNYAVEFLRKPANIRHITSLLDACSILECNIASKYCRIMRLSLELQAHQPIDSMDKIIPYDIISEQLQYILRPLLNAVYRADAHPLNTEEQILCLEITQLLNIIAKSLPYIKFSIYSDIQKWCVEKCFLRYTRTLSIVACLQMLYYDLRLASGSARGTYISHQLRETDLRDLMRSSITSYFSYLIQYCDSIKLYILQKIAEGMVLMKIPIRRSYIFELLDSANIGHFKTGIEYNLSLMRKRAERVLIVATGYIYSQQKPTTIPIPKIFFLTNYNFYIADKPEKIRNALADSAQTSEENSILPNITLKREYSDLTRIIRENKLTPFIALGWMIHVYDHLSETFDIIIFDCQDQVSKFCDILYALSGPEESYRVKMAIPMLIESQLLFYQIPIVNIIQVSVVLREDWTASRYPVLHILTEKCSVNFFFTIFQFFMNSR